MAIPASDLPAGFHAPWEDVDEAAARYPLEQPAYWGDQFVTVRVSPPRQTLTALGPNGQLSRHLRIVRLTVYARAGRVTMHLADGDDVTLLMLSDREVRGLAVGDPRRRLLRGTARGAPGAARAAARSVSMLVTWPYDVWRASVVSKERNDSLEVLRRRVRAVFPEATVGTV